MNPIAASAGVHSQFPSHWRKTRLSRLVGFGNGADYKAVECERPGYPVYGSGGRFKWANQWLHDGPSVLFGRKGTIDRPLYVEGKFWTVDTMYFTRPDLTLVDPKFLYYWATRFPFAYYATGTALPSMTQGDLGSETLGLPPLPEQRQIAAYLDHETAELDKLVSDLTKYDQLVLERFEGLLVSLVQPQLLEVSAEDVSSCRPGWLPTRLKTTVESSGNGKWGAEPFVEPVTRRCIRVADFDKTAGIIHDRNETARSYDQASVNSLELRTGDLLIEKSGGGPSSPVGNVVFYAAPGGDMYSNFVARIRVSPQTDPQFALYLHRALYLRGITARSIKQTTGIQNLDASSYFNERIWLPPRDVAAGLAVEAHSALSALSESREEIARSVELATERRAALISAAVTGQIDVSTWRKPAVEQLQDDLEEMR